MYTVSCDALCACLQGALSGLNLTAVGRRSLSQQAAGGAGGRAAQRRLLAAQAVANTSGTVQINDPLYLNGSQWFMSTIGMPQAWTAGTGAQTGPRPTHLSTPLESQGLRGTGGLDGRLISGSLALL